MTLAGIELSTYEAGAFLPVPDDIDSEPVRGLDVPGRIGEPFRAWLDRCYGDEHPADLTPVLRQIPMELYRRVPLDELCKVRFSSFIMMDESVEKAFRTEPRLTIHQKITNSMWRWGVGRAGWNEVCSAYEGIRSFEFGHPDFDIRLDHSTSFNECGFSEYSRTFLDGVFGYLVHHKGEHVMTIGFSLMNERRLLIQQVQLKKRRGNRWLFKLPKNYLEHVVDRFRNSFPTHRLFLVDGREVMGRSLSDYSQGLEQARKRAATSEKRLLTCAPEHAADYRRSIASSVEEAAGFQQCIDHARADMERIGSFYDATGRYRRGEALRVNRLTHHELEAA